ncbi:MAG: HEPN domain-containing protein [Bacteroidaceae bacterium]|nr:HEPN domain-containing protein [Bacteroidaceae bacterium]
MALTDEERQVLVEYRTQKAKDTLIEAKDNAKLNHWSLAANRLYYALFHMASALLISKGISTKTHSGTIRLLGKEFVQTGLLEKEDGNLISRLQNMRQSGDYDDLFDWTEEDVSPLIDKTASLLAKMENLL